MNIERLQSAIHLAHGYQDNSARALRALIAHIDALVAERAEMAAVLAEFHRAPLSISSVQPVLVLAERLNPDLVQIQTTGRSARALPPEDRCGELAPSSGFSCSQAKNHPGVHSAHSQHDLDIPAVEVWR